MHELVFYYALLALLILLFAYGIYFAKKPGAQTGKSFAIVQIISCLAFILLLVGNLFLPTLLPKFLVIESEALPWAG
jgi:hypothetical protein